MAKLLPQRKGLYSRVKTTCRSSTKQVSADQPPWSYMAASYCMMSSSCSTYDSFTRLLIDTHVITFIKYNNNFVIFLRRIFCSETFFALIFFPNFFFPNLFFRASLLRKIFSEGSFPRRIFFRNIFSPKDLFPKHLFFRKMFERCFGTQIYHFLQN